MISHIVLATMTVIMYECLNLKSERIVEDIFLEMNSQFSDNRLGICVIMYQKGFR